MANVDGLVDYGEDFTDAAMVVENLQTAYQVGKGMLAHVEAMAAKAEAATHEDQIAEASEDATEIDAVQDPIDPPAPVCAHAEPEDEAPAPIRRRMSFEFEGQT